MDFSGKVFDVVWCGEAAVLFWCRRRFCYCCHYYYDDATQNSHTYLQ
jgi:hypothetical protein